MSPNRTSPILMLIGSSLIFVSAIYVATREIAPFLRTEVGAQERWRQIAGGQLNFGVSAYSQDRLLLDCRAALSSVQALLDSERRTSAAETCLAASVEIVARNPADALGYYIAAYTNAILGKEAETRSFLLRSWAIAPNELWLAALRTRLFQEWPDMVGKVLPRVLESDIRLLGTTDEGRETLIRWYLANPDSRPAIADAVDDLPEQHRASFVAELKLQANEVSVR